jgi:aryl-alcohol dehydrogenase-like predicted oxidoreductase
MEGPLPAAIDRALPPERRGGTLAQKALHALLSRPGVWSVLLGMRRPAYVDDALPVLGWPPIDDASAAAVFAAARALV